MTEDFGVLARFDAFGRPRAATQEDLALACKNAGVEPCEEGWTFVPENFVVVDQPRCGYVGDAVSLDDPKCDQFRRQDCVDISRRSRNGMMTMSRLLPAGRHRWAVAWGSPPVYCDADGECTTSVPDPDRLRRLTEAGDSPVPTCGNTEECRCTLRVSDDRGEQMYNATATDDHDPLDGLVVTEGEYIATNTTATLSFVETGDAVCRVAYMITRHIDDSYEQPYWSSFDPTTPVPSIPIWADVQAVQSSEDSGVDFSVAKQIVVMEITLSDVCAQYTASIGGIQTTLRCPSVISSDRVVEAQTRLAELLTQAMVESDEAAASSTNGTSPTIQAMGQASAWTVAPEHVRVYNDALGAQSATATLQVDVLGDAQAQRMVAQLQLLSGNNQTAPRIATALQTELSAVSAPRRGVVLSVLSNASDTGLNDCLNGCSLSQALGWSTSAGSTVAGASGIAAFALVRIEVSGNGTVQLQAGVLWPHDLGQTLAALELVGVGSAPVVIEGNQNQFMHISAASNRVRLVNLVLRDCRVGAGMTPPNGGAIMVSAGHLMAHGCRFEDNTVDVGVGGAVAVGDLFGSGGLAFFEDCEFSRNRGVAGGAVSVQGFQFVCLGCLFTSNRAEGSNPDQPEERNAGGAVSLVGNTGFFVLDRTIFNNNSVASGGQAAAFNFEPISTDATGNLSAIQLIDNFVGERRAGGTLLKLGQPSKWFCEPGLYGPPTGDFASVLDEDGTFTDGNFISCPGRCARGYYGSSEYETAPTCTGTCPRGHYCPEATAEPIPCPVGTHNPEEGAAAEFACVKCAYELTSDILGNPGYCVCAAGYYDTLNPAFAGGSPECAQCPIGTNCTTANITVESMPLRYGYWRPVMTSPYNVTICPDADSPTSACRGGLHTCKPGHGGPFCTQCLEENTYFSVATSDCFECQKTAENSHNSAAVVIFLLVVCVLAVGAGALWWSKKHKKLKRFWRVVELVMANKQRITVKIKLLLSFYQIATRVGPLYDVPLPSAAKKVFVKFEFVNLKLDSLGLPLECVNLHGYRNHMLTLLTVPMAMSGGLFIFGLIALPILLKVKQNAERQTKKAARMLGMSTKKTMSRITAVAVDKRSRSTASSKSWNDDGLDPGDIEAKVDSLDELDGMEDLDALGDKVLHEEEQAQIRLTLYDLSRECALLVLPTVLKISFFAWPVVTSYAFRGFGCVKFEGYERVMKEDFEVECDSDEYRQIRRLAVAGVALYGFAVPLSYLGLLMGQRKALIKGIRTEMTEALDFLHREYEPHFFWWEIVKVVEKLYLIGFAAFVFPGSIIQLIISWLAASAFLVIQMESDPYKLLEDNFLASCCCFSNTTFFIFLMVVKMVAFAEEVETYQPGVATDFLVDRSGLSIGLIAAVLGVLVLTGLLLLLRLAALHRHVKKQAQQEAFRLTHALNTAELTALQSELADEMLPESLKRFKVDPAEVELGDRLGFGTYGEVFLGKWHGTKVAVKRIHRHEINAAGLRIFKDEAVLMIKLASPNIVQLLGVSFTLHDANVWMLLEFCQRGTLQDLLTGPENESLTWGSHKLGIALGLARALAHLHKQTPPIIHRDLKPENVLVDDAFNPKLGDFGASRESSKATSTMRGTPLYAAPEMLRSEKMTKEVDQWSYACCLEVMWTHAEKLYADRHLPFEEILNGVAEGTIFPRVPRISFLADLVCACSATKASSRPAFTTVIEVLTSADMSVAAVSLPPGPGPLPDDEDLKVGSPIDIDELFDVSQMPESADRAKIRELERENYELRAELARLRGEAPPPPPESSDGAPPTAEDAQGHHHHHHHKKKKKHRKPPGMMAGIEKVISAPPPPPDGEDAPVGIKIAGLTHERKKKHHKKHHSHHGSDDDHGNVPPGTGDASHRRKKGAHRSHNAEAGDDELEMDDREELIGVIPPGPGRTSPVHLGRLNAPPPLPDDDDGDPPPPPRPGGHHHRHKGAHGHSAHEGEEELEMDDQDELIGVIPPGPGRTSPVHVGRLNAPPLIAEMDDDDDDPMAHGWSERGLSEVQMHKHHHESHRDAPPAPPAGGADDDDYDDPVAHGSSERGLSEVQMHKHHHKGHAAPKRAEGKADDDDDDDPMAHAQESRGLSEVQMHKHHHKGHAAPKRAEGKADDDDDDDPMAHAQESRGLSEVQMHKHHHGQ